MGTLDLYRK